MNKLAGIGGCVIALAVLLSLSLRPDLCSPDPRLGNKLIVTKEVQAEMMKQFKTTHLPWWLDAPLSKKEITSLAGAVRSAAWRDVLNTLSIPGIRSLPSEVSFAWRCRALVPAESFDGFLMLTKAWDPKSSRMRTYVFWKCGNHWVRYGSKHG